MHDLLLALRGGFLAVDSSYRILAGLICLDIATGVCASIIEGQLASKVAWPGLVRKCVELMLVAAMSLVEPIIKVDASLMAALFFTLYEALSILENASRCGLPVPAKLRDVLAAISPDDKPVVRPVDPTAATLKSTGE